MQLNQRNKQADRELAAITKQAGEFPYEKIAQNSLKHESSIARSSYEMLDPPGLRR